MTGGIRGEDGAARREGTRAGGLKGGGGKPRPGGR